MIGKSFSNAQMCQQYPCCLFFVDLLKPLSSISCSYLRTTLHEKKIIMMKSCMMKHNDKIHSEAETIKNSSSLSSTLIAKHSLINHTIYYIY